MNLLGPRQVSPEQVCPYIKGELTRHEFFLAAALSESELEEFLSKGFRKFGIYFFRPKCTNCQKCLPLRVEVTKFSPSKSQRRILKKNRDIEIKYTPLIYREEIYQLYLKHSKERFSHTNDEPASKEEFIQTHFTQSAPSLLSEFYLNGHLIAVGFLDISSNGVSSMYFIYDPELSKRSLGIFGALCEIEFAHKVGKLYYYLGYYIEENTSMNYKNQFLPFQIFNWTSETWETQRNPKD